jgi:hypothetical protein
MMKGKSDRKSCGQPGTRMDETTTVADEVGVMGVAGLGVGVGVSVIN